jgi:cell division protein FtsB
MPTLSPVRLVLSLLPALALFAVAASTVWADGGLMARYRLQQRKQDLIEEISALSRENARLAREISLLEEEPLAAQREIADSLGLAPAGAVLYTFAKPGEQPVVGGAAPSE